MDHLQFSSSPSSVSECLHCLATVEFLHCCRCCRYHCHEGATVGDSLGNWTWSVKYFQLWPLKYFPTSNVTQCHIPIVPSQDMWQDELCLNVMLASICHIIVTKIFSLFNNKHVSLTCFSCFRFRKILKIHCRQHCRDPHHWILLQLQHDDYQE